MTASESTVLQVNYRTPSGALVNVYASTPDQFDSVMDFLASRIDKIVSVESVLSGASNVGQQIPVTPVVQAPPAPPAQTWAPVDPGPPPAAAWGPPTPAPQQGTGIAPVCAHGQRVPKKGNGAKGEWKSWFCSGPKGGPQCDAVWVQKGSPEWNSHPV